jgi:energy-converting hydrogenase Eha subunit C
MTTQIINAFFHIFFSFYFHDFSPGTITALLLYLPVNYLIFKAALREGHLESTKQMMYLFILGACTFALFEALGPIVLVISLLLSPIYYFAVNKYDYK